MQLCLICQSLNVSVKVIQVKARLCQVFYKRSKVCPLKGSKFMISKNNYVAHCCFIHDWWFTIHHYSFTIQIASPVKIKESRQKKQDDKRSDAKKLTILINAWGSLQINQKWIATVSRYIKLRLTLLKKYLKYKSATPARTYHRYGRATTASYLHCTLAQKNYGIL